MLISLETDPIVFGGKRLDLVATGGYATIDSCGFFHNSNADSGSTFNGLIIQGNGLITK